MGFKSNQTYVLTAVILLGILGFLFYFQNHPPSYFSDKIIAAEVIKIKDDSIVVEGRIEDLGKKYSEIKTIEFRIAPETALRNRAVLITRENAESGGPFLPQVQERPGKFEDFKGRDILVINSVISKENLFGTSKATALEIDYSLIIYEK